MTARVKRWTHDQMAGPGGGGKKSWHRDMTETSCLAALALVPAEGLVLVSPK